NATNTLSASNQSLAGNCKINSLSVQPTPAFVVNP
ncbi:protein activator, partial [Pseudomonas aeruginosa]|nr:protein activator [Pseudomonas aeruginosa]